MISYHAKHGCDLITFNSIHLSLTKLSRYMYIVHVNPPFYYLYNPSNNCSVNIYYIYNIYEIKLHILYL